MNDASSREAMQSLLEIITGKNTRSFVQRSDSHLKVVANFMRRIRIDNLWMEIIRSSTDDDVKPYL